MESILCFYNASQTYTNNVYEHLNAFSKYSKFRYFYCDHDSSQYVQLDLSRFDAIVVHYSIRLPFDQVSESLFNKLVEYKGLKVLYIQDEYDHTCKAWSLIRKMGFNLVFTVVPKHSISYVYPSDEFSDVRFVNILTGYVPDEGVGSMDTIPPSKRQMTVGYRGRSLPLRYGELGKDKVNIAKIVKEYCQSNNISHDIEWKEEKRIYGDDWYKFMFSCRAMLGTESGSNVFDWDGALEARIADIRQYRPKATDEEIYREVVKACEVPGVMNQISPRIFEAISSRTALILYEGQYSGIICPGVHFIELKKDGSNLDEVFSLLKDGKYIDALTERAYKDVILPGEYSYEAFVNKVDEEMKRLIRWQTPGLIPAAQNVQLDQTNKHISLLTMTPIRPRDILIMRINPNRYSCAISEYIPEGIKKIIRPILRLLQRRYSVGNQSV